MATTVTADPLVRFDLKVPRSLLRKVKSRAAELDLTPGAFLRVMLQLAVDKYDREDGPCDVRYLQAGKRWERKAPSIIDQDMIAQAKVANAYLTGGVK